MSQTQSQTKGETMTGTIERAELRVTPCLVQVNGEDGMYNAQRGWQIEARVPCRRGDAQYTYQGVFETYGEAQSKVEQLCGDASNGFHADIDTESDARWLFTGASY